jgi:hypothetical protein
LIPKNDALLKEAIKEYFNPKHKNVTDFHDAGNQVTVALGSFSFSTKNCFCYQWFCSEINAKCVPKQELSVITEPITDLDIKGTFHLDRGYYYFRNIEDLLGGGRNLDFETETQQNLVRQKLKKKIEQL